MRSKVWRGLLTRACSFGTARVNNPRHTLFLHLTEPVRNAHLDQQIIELRSLSTREKLTQIARIIDIEFDA